MSVYMLKARVSKHLLAMALAFAFLVAVAHLC